ncbi:lymphatic vessel endothelial hyaluronic acid receptor 1a [Chanos chanos]|uniref:Lymphatic vessel endothelial hyaluronic acid receptor 1a n=1 Tax=Chanos chanos TaxID=29144 RepID=A0A6J2ULS4_CHACN|nr:lymphatic vessel endothelial hyaluronic acid receptor 1-like [Chanos chanos]
MARVWLVTLLLTKLSVFADLIDHSQIKVTPAHGTIVGVFKVSYGDYSFNASTAREVCQVLGVTIASKTQVQEALSHGLETCRFGWTDEQVAVIPRVQQNPKCGNGKIGLVVWRADVNKRFDVFCFNATDLEAQIQVTTADVHTTRRDLTSTQSSLLSTGEARFDKSSRSFAHASESSSTLTSLSVSPSPSHHTLLEYPKQMQKPQSMSSEPSSIGTVPAVLLITAIFTVLLTVVIAVWRFKMKQHCVSCWDAEEQKEYIETEVWDQSNGKDQREPQAEFKEDQSRKNSNDISVKMTPETDTDS